MKRKFLCLLLALVLALGLAATVSAAPDASVTWTLTDGLLTISGAGPMADYAEGQAPWLDDEVYSLIIEDGITSIGSNAFRGMELLIDVVISRTVTTIDATAFNDCPALDDVIFRGDGHIIPSGTFSNCPNLSVFRFAGDMPALEVGSLLTGYTGVMDNIITVQYDKSNATWENRSGDQFAPGEPIEYYAYQNHLGGSGTCGDDLTWQILLTDVSYMSHYLVISGTGPMYDYTEGEAPWLDYIADNHLTVRGLYILPGVTYIGENAFAGMGVSSTGIPGSVREIGASAYRKNTNLNNPYLGANIRSVGDYAYAETGTNYLVFGNPHAEFGTGIFQGCKSLTKANLPEGMTAVPAAMFSGCNTLRETTIPTTVSSIGTNAFSGCTRLKTVNYFGTTTQWAAIDVAEGNDALLNATLEGVLTTGGTCGENALWELSEDFATLTISGSGAVTSCPWANAARTVETIIVEDGITSLCDSAFYGFEVVTEISLPETLTEIGSDCFRNNYALPGLELPAGLAKLGSNAFTWCSSLKSMAIPDGITTISDHLLSYCSALESVEMSENVTAIGSGAFTNCTSLSRINIPTGLTELGSNAFLGCKNLTIQFVWPEAVTRVGDALQGSGITEVVLPDTVTHIGAYAFMGCTNLETINIPDSVTAIGERAFASTSSLKSIRIPNGITTIPFSCFSASGITEISLPDGLTTIEQYAFQHCANLASVRLPESVTGIADQVFSYCSSLSKVNWPSGVDTIGWHQFNGTALTEFTVPATVKLVESYAFKDCTKLEKLVFESKDTVVTGSQIFDNDDLLTIYCWYDSSAQAAAEFSMIPYVLFDAPTDLPRYPVLTTVSGDGEIIATPAESTGFEWITVDIVPGENSVLYGLDLYYYAYEEMELRIEEVDGDTFRLLMPKCPVEIVAAFQDTITGFIDIKSADFYYEPVIWAVENGITTGTSDITFEPVRDVTRAEVVTFLWRASGSPVAALDMPFTDVPEGSFCYDAIAWAVSEGITTGTSDTTFSPLKTCTRAEVVTFLYRAAGQPRVEDGGSFSDVDPSHFYADAVLWASVNGITNGMGDGTFGAALVCNRAQIVTFLYRAKDIPKAEPVTRYTFGLRSGDPTGETGFVFCEGTEFAAGESVIFYAEPWYGYLVEFEAQPDVELELYYLGACTYELIMPDHDVVLTANFVPAPGEPHYITTTCANGFAMAVCDVDGELNDIAKAGEFVQFYIVPDEGFTFSPGNFSVTAGGQPLEDWWYLGKLSEADPELGISDGIYLVELRMPDADVTVSITCTPGTETAAAAVRVPVTVR